MKVILGTLIFISVSTSEISSASKGSRFEDILKNAPPEAFMNTPEIIRHYNYTVEDHNVTTADGYILTMFRIPPRDDNAFDSTRSNSPVILQHGLLSSSNDWFIIQPEDTLPFMLADAGYDVWIGNCRGNNYSQGHVSESVDSTKFWDFSFHEMGVYDVPAVMKYVLRSTGKEKLNYIGHSMGTTMFFIAMDQHPELQSKVHKMVALSPAVYLSHAKTPLTLLALLPSFALRALLDALNGGRILSEQVNAWLNTHGPGLCAGSIPAAMCENIFFFATGYDYESTSNMVATMIAGHSPSEGSGKTLVHYLQWVKTPAFRNYDYGEYVNMAKYGSARPPLYSLSNIHVETLVMYGINDWLVVPQDAQRTIDELANAVPMIVSDVHFNHLDFLYGTDARGLVYDPAIAFLQSH